CFPSLTTTPARSARSRATYPWPASSALESSARLAVRTSSTASPPRSRPSSNPASRGVSAVLHQPASGVASARGVGSPEKDQVEAKRGDSPPTVDAPEREVVIADELRVPRRSGLFDRLTRPVMTVVDQIGDSGGLVFTMYLNLDVGHDVTGQ